MNMFREAFLLLRRSRGERVTSLQVRLFMFFALFALILVGTGFLALTLTGGWSAEQKQLTWLDAETVHVISRLSGDFNRLSPRGVSFARQLSSSISHWAEDKGISEGEIAAYPELIENLLAEQVVHLLSVIENNICTGAFIILNATVNPLASNAEYSKAGIFFKRREPNVFSTVAQTVHYLRGPASIARANVIELMAQWKMEFDISEMDFFNMVIENAHENPGADLSRLYYWSERYLMDGNSEHSMLLCIPLIGRDGTVYGISGIEVSDMQFKRMYSPESLEHHRAFIAFAPTDGSSLDTDSGLIAGNFYLTSQTTGLLSFAGVNKGVESWRSENGEMYKGRSEPLQLYPTGSPYINENWAVSLLIPSVDWETAIQQGNTVLLGIGLTLLITSLIAAVFISRRYIRPVAAALQLIKSDSRDSLPKTKIAEIEDLFKYLAVMDEERKTVHEEKENLAAELGRMKHRGSEDEPQEKPISPSLPESGTPVVKAYEQFLRNLETLTATERAVFNLYIKNHTAQEIADKLFVSINTIKFHNKNIYPKLNVTSLKEIKVYTKMMEEALDSPKE